MLNLPTPRVEREEIYSLRHRLEPSCIRPADPDPMSLLLAATAAGPQWNARTIVVDASRGGPALWAWCGLLLRACHKGRFVGQPGQTPAFRPGPLWQRSPVYRAVVCAPRGWATAEGTATARAARAALEGFVRVES